MIAQHDFEMMRGDTFEIDVYAYGDIGTVSVITMTARRQATDVVLFTVTATAQTGGGWRITIPPSATVEATPGVYKYDVQFKMSDGKIHTPLNGNFRLIEDQTREVLS